MPKCFSTLSVIAYLFNLDILNISTFVLSFFAVFVTWPNSNSLCFVSLYKVAFLYNLVLKLMFHIRSITYYAYRDERIYTSYCMFYFFF